MAFAISEDRTVLWDQFEYSGNPRDFSWVLPVAPGAYLEESTDAFFEALEGVTATRVTAPQLQCASSDSGCSRALASSDDASGANFLAGGSVEVLHRGTVGPYETVTLRSTDGDSLRSWLEDNGYTIPEDIEPIIEAYVSEGADFVALKLQPNQGIQQMTPVRVVTPQGDPILPLRMVAAGTGQYVDIVLYIIGEERFGMPDLEESFVDWTALTWDFSTSTSNYPALRTRALDGYLGHTYITTYARRGAFTATSTGQFGFPISYTTTSQDIAVNVNTLGELYFAQAFENDNLAFTPGSDCQTALANLTSGDLVTVDGKLRPHAFECGGFTDLASAMTGQHPSNVWVSRLELRLPREALAMDCVVESAKTQDEVDNDVLALKSKNRPPGCPEPIFASRISRGTATGRDAVLWGMGIGAGLWLFRRRRSRRS